MRLRMIFILGVLLLFGVAAIRTTALRAPNNQDLKQAEVQLPITIKQLQSGNGNPVELLCGTANVTRPNRLNGFECTLRNNSGKSISAATVIYSTVLEEDGRETKDPKNHTLTTYIHPDFYDKAKNILPGGTTSFKPGAIITYDSAVIKGVEVYIDYVEFEDNTSIGPNQDGSRIINDLREGAKKYKRWLGDEYAHKSIDATIEALKSEEGLAGFSNPAQEEGARRYRKQLQKAYKNGGRTKVEKYLSKIQRETN